MTGVVTSLGLPALAGARLLARFSSIHSGLAPPINSARNTMRPDGILPSAISVPSSSNGLWPNFLSMKWGKYQNSALRSSEPRALDAVCWTEF